MAATKVKEWTLATKSKQEKNMVVVGSRRSVGTSTSFLFKQVYLFVPAHTQMFFFLYGTGDMSIFISYALSDSNCQSSILGNFSVRGC